jgi:hypothetical protein
MDEQIQRILSVIDIENEEDADVTRVTLTRFFNYLKENIKMPCKLTGIEDLGCFSWEEYYTFGPGNKREYKKLKKKYPSYTDEYELISFEDYIDEESGILVNVRRISDKKKFTLPLADLEAVDKKSKNGLILDDYAVWFVNYR